MFARTVSMVIQYLTRCTTFTFQRILTVLCGNGRNLENSLRALLIVLSSWFKLALQAPIAYGKSKLLANAAFSHG
jgi:hypothetical protein